MDNALVHHPIDPLRLHPILKCLCAAPPHRAPGSFALHVASVHVEDQDGDNVIQSRRDIWCQHLVHPRDHHLLIHPGSFLALVKVGIGVCFELLLCNAAIWLPLEDKGRREYRTIHRDLYHHGDTLSIIRWRANVDGFFPMSSRVRFELLKFRPAFGPFS